MTSTSDSEKFIHQCSPHQISFNCIHHTITHLPTPLWLNTKKKLNQCHHQSELFNSCLNITDYQQQYKNNVFNNYNNHYTNMPSEPQSFPLQTSRIFLWHIFSFEFVCLNQTVVSKYNRCIKDLNELINNDITPHWIISISVAIFMLPFVGDISLISCWSLNLFLFCMALWWK